ncbi:MAG TPA: biosynthetic peptidoglycan transglycosylase [Kofleriaceae bacterium]|nr:biosynthetic peptidoglycan transglycosylase [Kofleriaceae bacterium]
MTFSREHRLLLATALIAVGAPVGAAAWVGGRTQALADRLGAAAGVPARIGAVDADLTGTVRITDVALGGVVSADAIEASTSLGDGPLGADEIRVASPHVALDVDPGGDSDLARLVRRLARGGGTGGGAARLRRIVVSSGSLTARIAGIGELSADDVELVPDAGGVRVITGRVRVTGGAGRVHGQLELQRAAGELALPHARFGRVLAVAGAGTIDVAGRAIAVRDVAIGRLVAGGPLEVRATLDGRPIAVEVTPELAIAIRGDRVPLGSFAPLAPHGLDVADARATGELRVRRDGDTVQIAADGALDGVVVDHRALAPEPVALPELAVRGALALSPDAIASGGIELGLGASHWRASGWLRRGTPASAQLALELAPAPCADLVATLPLALRGPLDAMNLTGTFAGKAHLAIDLAAPAGEGVELDSELANACEVTAEPPAADVATLGAPGDQTFADGSHARIGKGLPGWVELRHLPGYVPGAFVAAEDARFFEHHGFDEVQIARSLEIDLRDHRLARGGSTISQQLIKNAFLTQRRSLDRKIQEAILTWRLEARLDKKTILERYLNLIELGPHVFGLDAAARHWFGESPSELSVHQAAFLAALTAEPQSMSRRVRHAGGLDPDSAARVDIVLHAMRKADVIDGDQVDAARLQPLRFAPAALRAEP